MYSIRYNRTTNHLDGIEARSAGKGEESGGAVSYYPVGACGALTRGRFAHGKSFESIAEALDAARKTGGRKLCKMCERAALALIEAETPAEHRWTHGEYATLTHEHGTEGVMIEENHGPAEPGGPDLITVRFANSETCTTVRATALNR